jgi:hypothetical protein
MKKIRWLTLLIFTIGVVLFSTRSVYAFPPLPSSFNGTVKINGTNVPSGTIVSAWINGVPYKSAIVVYVAPNMKYLLNVPGDDSATPDPVIEGGVDGDIIVFYIGNIKATQTATWNSGTNVSLNLTGTGELARFTIFLPLVRR